EGIEFLRKLRESCLLFFCRSPARKLSAQSHAKRLDRLKSSPHHKPVFNNLNGSKFKFRSEIVPQRQTVSRIAFVFIDRDGNRPAFLFGQFLNSQNQLM